jgi:NADH-quinone oxidoreductase subunit E
MIRPVAEHPELAVTSPRVLSETMRGQIEAYLPRYPTKQAVVLPALHVVQEQLRCVPARAIGEIAELLELAPAEVHDTMSFYGFFRSAEQPLGRHRCWVCRSISCAVRGGEELLAALCRKLGVSPGGTTEDGRITVEFAECLGGCDFAPCLLLDGVLYKNLTEQAIDDLVRSLE